jgi:colanic acid biosynthesis glycosyl transferase WcaI
MRLTLINQFYPPDLAPTGHLAASLAEHRAERGDQVTVVTSPGGYVPGSPPRPRDEAGNPRVLRVWSPQLGKGSHLKRILDYAAFYFLAALRLLTLPGQEVIISLTTPPFIAFAGLLHKLIHRSTKLVLWSMDCYPEVLERAGMIGSRSWIGRAMRWLNRALFRRLDALVCLDSAMAKVLLSQYGAQRPDLQAVVIPNWERRADFPPGTRPPAWAMADTLGLRDRFVVLYLGNAGFGHRFETVLEAAEELRDDPVVFLFVGGGAAWPSLAEAKRARALDNLVLHGYVPKEETPSLMAVASCGLITLRDEFAGVISPSKLHGYLAMGLPVIYVGPQGSNVGEALRRYRCGVRFAHGDVEGMVAFIRGMMRDQEELAGLRQRARQAFEGAYSDARALPEFDQLLDGLVDT